MIGRVLYSVHAYDGSEEEGYERKAGTKGGIDTAYWMYDRLRGDEMDKYPMSHHYSTSLYTVGSELLNLQCISGILAQIFSFLTFPLLVVLSSQSTYL